MDDPDLLPLRNGRRDEPALGRSQPDSDAYKEFFGASSGVSPWPPLINSATASILSTVTVTVLAIPAAYALSIKPVKKWTDVMFFFLSTKMMPVIAAILPLYLFAKTTGAPTTSGS